MNRISSSIFLLVFFYITASAQSQAETYIQEAQGYLAQKNYTQARLSLQDAINEINNMTGGQVSEALPAEINGLRADDNTSSSGGVGMMGGGMAISKSYRHPSKPENDAEVVILANAPMLSAMNMYLTNPAMMGSGYKSIRIGTTRAILKSEMQEYYGDNDTPKKIRSTEIQIPLSQTLITINAHGFATEQEELAFATKLDLDKLKTLLGE
jgi:hypothetical protein